MFNLWRTENDMLSWQIIASGQHDDVNWKMMKLAESDREKGTHMVVLPVGQEPFYAPLEPWSRAS